MARLFLISLLLVLPFWFLMVFLPHLGLTRRIMRTRWSILLPAAMYAALLVPQLDSLAAFFLRPDLAVLAGLLAKAPGALLAWLHLLCFDLVVGRWVYLDGRERGIPPWVVSPVLLLVFFLGPVGFLVHMGIRALHEVGLRRKTRQGG